MEKTIQKIPFLRITFALAIGIYLGSIFNIPNQILFVSFSAVLSFLILLNRYYSYRFNSYFGIGIHFLFILFGIFVVQQYNSKPVFFENGKFVAIVVEVPQEKANSFKSILRITHFIKNDSLVPTDEKVIAYFNKKNYTDSLKPGDELLIKALPQKIKNNGNPFEFDYKKYLERKRIYRQVYLQNRSWVKTNNSTLSVITLAEKAREKLLQIYRNQSIDETELEIISALTLGYKRELDPETKRIFSAAGAMHVLAVSGLHVGIIFWLISMVFGFMRKNKTGRLIFVSLTIFLLWTYAFITGLSPSVLRASTMFTIYIVGENMQRKANVYNSLAASAHILLLVNPNNLFELGFQLSYSAVFGIVFLQPKLSRLIKTEYSVLRFFSDLLTVSISAQIATFPFTLYYFGQFPSYFLITNIIIIPSVMFLIPMGISLLIFSKIPAVATIISFCLNHFIKFIYLFLTFIEQLPYSVLHSSVNELQFLLILLILSSVFLFLKNFRYYFVKFALLFILFFSLSSLYNSIKRVKSNEIIVYNSADNAIIQLIHGNLNYIISENNIEKEDYVHRDISATTQKLKLNPPIYLIKSDSLAADGIFINNGIIYFEGKNIVFCNNSINFEKYFPADFVINPSENGFLETLNKNCQLIITNKRFIPEFKIKNYRFHNTAFEGAFRYNW